jgi:hypothetical protein
MGRRLGVMVHTCNPSTEEVEEEGLRIQGHPGLHVDTLCHKKIEQARGLGEGQLFLGGDRHLNEEKWGACECLESNPGGDTCEHTAVWNVNARPFFMDHQGQCG